MLDKKKRFVIDKNTNTIHDILCNKVPKIPGEAIECAEEVDETLTICKSCQRKLYVRSAIKDDENFQWYLDFFDEGPLSTNQIKGSLFKYKAELKKLSNTELQVKYNEDTWIFQYVKRNRYNLFHNDYIVVSDTERKILPSFHRQKAVPLRLKDLMRFIAVYEWKASYHQNEEQ